MGTTTLCTCRQSSVEASVTATTRRAGAGPDAHEEPGGSGIMLNIPPRRAERLLVVQQGPLTRRCGTRAQPSLAVASDAPLVWAHDHGLAQDFLFTCRCQGGCPESAYQDLRRSLAGGTLVRRPAAAGRRCRGGGRSRRWWGSGRGSSVPHASVYSGPGKKLLDLLLGGDLRVRATKADPGLRQGGAAGGQRLVRHRAGGSPKGSLVERGNCRVGEVGDAVLADALAG